MKRVKNNVVELATWKAAVLGRQFMAIILQGAEWLERIDVERDALGKPTFVLHCRKIDDRIRGYAPNVMNHLPVRLVLVKGAKRVS